MRTAFPLLAGLLALSLLCPAPDAAAQVVRVKELGRFDGWRENAVVGYGIVTGLTGSGDSPRNPVARQTLANVLGRLGLNVDEAQVQSRNVAAVIVTASLPPTANTGDRIDVSVSSVGDARSLVGGTLLMTPMLGADQKTYALAQGQVLVGGHRFEADLVSRQKNYPASGAVPGGATIEAPVRAEVLGADGRLTFLLRDPDFTTAVRVADTVNAAFGTPLAQVRGADAITIRAGGGDVYRLIARLEGLTVQPDAVARVVVNERAGTVVAGGGARISSASVSQGDIRVTVTVDLDAAQPTLFGGYAPGVRSLVVANTRLDVEEPERDVTARFGDTTVADLMEGLSRVRVDTRGKIAVLQALKAAGALHADIVVQ
jgi:flagellar P-ring protein precursor FlgI